MSRHISGAVAELTVRPSDRTASGSIRLIWYKLGQKIPSKSFAREGGNGKLNTSYTVPGVTPVEGWGEGEGEQGLLRKDSVSEKNPFDAFILNYYPYFPYLIKFASKENILTRFPK